MKHKHACSQVVAGKATQMHRHCGHIYGEHTRFFPQPPASSPQETFTVTRAQLEQWAGAFGTANSAAVALLNDYGSPYARFASEINGILHLGENFAAKALHLDG